MLINANNFANRDRAEYLKDFNATQAARRAGYAQDPDVAGATAARLLAQPEIANEIATSMRAVLDRAEFSLSAGLLRCGEWP
jgi:phage terminase small subunit